MGFLVTVGGTACLPVETAFDEELNTQAGEQGKVSITFPGRENCTCKDPEVGPFLGRLEGLHRGRGVWWRKGTEVAIGPGS